MSRYTNRIFSALISCMVIAALSSCSTPKHNVIVMSDLETSNAGTLGMSIPELTIVPDDELMINVTADVPQAAAIYNLPLNVNVPRSDLKTGVSMERIHTYRVDKQGNINFPVLGKLHVAGMTTTALADELVKRISADVENPVVVVDLLNFKVKVTGDVKTPGVIESDKQHISVLDALAAAGFPCEIISSGSTPTFEIAVKDKTLNVSHPGNYTFFDNIQISLGTCGEDACSLRVLATVVSHPSEGFYLFDAGSKCLGLDQGAHGNSAIKGFGYVVGHPELTIVGLSEEVAKVKADGTCDLQVGDQVEIIPNHSCSTANNTGWDTCMRGDEIVDFIAVDARENSKKKGTL